MIKLAPHDNKVAIEFFRTYCFGTDVSKKLHPNAFKSGNSDIKNVGSVAKPFSDWNKLGYTDIVRKNIKKINKKKTTYEQGFVSAYRLNLNPVYEEFAKKGINLILTEKKLLNDLLDNQIIRNFIIDWNNINNKEKYKENIYETTLLFLQSIAGYSPDFVVGVLVDTSIDNKYKDVELLLDDFDDKNRNFMQTFHNKIGKAYKYFPALAVKSMLKYVKIKWKK
jgi:hypothetical protein